MRNSRQNDDDAPVLSSLVFYFRDLYRANLARSRYMRAAAGLQIHDGVVGTDLHQSQPSGAARRLYRKRPHSAGFSSSTDSSTQ